MSMTMVVHKVEISLEGENVKADPNTLDNDVWKGHKLQINSNHGSHRVVFKPWPFEEKEPKDGIVTNDEFTFERSGEFEFFCYFTPEGEVREHTYPKAGGGHGIVRP
jgi:plastocyanin